MSVRQVREIESLLRPGAAAKRGIFNDIYMAIVSILVIGVPLWMALRDAIHDGDNIFALTVTVPPQSIILSLAIPLAVTAFTLGASVGPIRGKPFDLHVLKSSPIDRRVSFGIRMVRTALILTGVFTGIVVILWTLSPANLINGFIGILTSLAVALLIVSAWLLGSIVPIIIARLISATALIALLVLFLNVSIPQYLNLFVVGINATIIITILTTVTSIFVTLRALIMISGEGVVQQAFRWQRVVASSWTGDLATASTELGASTGIGRNWRLPKNLGWWGTNVWLDLLVFCRSPWRILWIIALETVAIYLLVNGGTLGVAIAAVAQYLALTCFNSSLRFGAELALPPRTFGGSSFRNIAGHLPLPIIIHLIATNIGMLVLQQHSIPNALNLAAWTVLLIPFHCLLLCYTALKRQPPYAIMVPSSSPMGDFSGVQVLIWQIDFLVIAALLGIVGFTFISNQSLVSLLTLLAIGCYILLGIRRRFRRI